MKTIDALEQAQARFRGRDYGAPRADGFVNHYPVPVQDGVLTGRRPRLRCPHPGCAVWFGDEGAYAEHYQWEHGSGTVTWADNAERVTELLRRSLEVEVAYLRGRGFELVTRPYEDDDRLVRILWRVT